MYIFLLYVCIWVFGRSNLLFQWKTFEENNWTQKRKEKKKTDGSQTFDVIIPLQQLCGQNQPGTSLKIINDLQRNQPFLHHLCSAKRTPVMPAQQKQTWSISTSIQQDGQNHCALEPEAHLNLFSYFPRRYASPPPITVPLLSGMGDSSRQEHQNCRFFTIDYKETQFRLVEVPYATQFWMHTTGNKR